MRILSLSLLFCLPVCGRISAQDVGPGDPSPHSEAVLLAETTSMQPGVPFTVGLHLTLDPEWHSYWKNPGDSGEATSITWYLPDGFEAGEIEWPAPQRITFPPLVSYGYFDEVLLLVEITPPEGLAAGDTVRLEGRADWLVCIEDCFPAEAPLAISVPVSGDRPVVDPEVAPLFEAARAQLPLREPGWQGLARANDRFYGLKIDPPGHRETFFEDERPDTHFFAARSDVVDHATDQRPDWDGETLAIRLERSAFASGTPDTLSGVLVTRRDSEGRAVESFEISVPTVIAGPSPGQATASIESDDDLGLGLGLLFAFLGGLLLNLMPCVFPVLSLKVLGFAQHADRGKSAAARQGGAFAAGVLASFWALGALLLVLRAAGAGIGWGFQLQSPLFVGGMAVLFFLLGLALLGVFEIGTALTRLAEFERGSVEGADSGSSGGVSRSFLSGVLATIVATPCTAPFMGAALGWAMVRPPGETMLVFTALGAGMAAPYLVLSLSPGLIDRLPAPGPWMETLKQLLAFPLFATVIWLAWVFGLQTGVGGLTRLLVALLLVGIAVWIPSRWGGLRAPASRRLAARIAAGAVGIAALAVLVGASRMQLTSPAGDDATWLAWSPAAQEEALRSSEPLFVDYTAAWCLSCQVNDRLVLETAEIRRAFADRGVTLMKADWTSRDPEIADALADLGRSSVPVYALYPPGAVDPVLLPSVLTKQIVTDALAAHVP